MPIFDRKEQKEIYLTGSDTVKIDFVIPWVDGNDPKWKIEMDKYSPTKADESNSVNRYRDWGLLPYWFRAAE